MYDYSEFWLYLGGTLVWALMTYGYVVIERWFKRK
jgi:hypothetical protein